MHAVTRSEWEYYVNRSARWVDFDNDYKTMDLSYMESVMWAFKQLWDKGLVYEGYRVVPYSWAAQTPLSNFETRLDDAYRERQDPALTVRFQLAAAGRRGGRAEAAGLDDDAVDAAVEPGARGRARRSTTRVLRARAASASILADASREHYAKELDGFATRRHASRARELSAARYEPLFPFFADDAQNAFRVLGGDFVEHRRGHRRRPHRAGLRRGRHRRRAQAAGIPVVDPVDDEGRFTAEVPP